MRRRAVPALCERNLNGPFMLPLLVRSSVRALFQTSCNGSTLEPHTNPSAHPDPRLRSTARASHDRRLPWLARDARRIRAGHAWSKAGAAAASLSSTGAGVAT
jgi:hypothetical protein